MKYKYEFKEIKRKSNVKFIGVNAWNHLEISFCNISSISSKELKEKEEIEFKLLRAKIEIAT
ncbi:Hypothetical predicted protein [Paramuricea clavata]|uniref:Uncharacterized protein n=1 Tax=Paramuricea clavata TaxID=317549 RepID=A0A6S7GP22_PARCT|nr:Hypothetical predicted protein [Paramuricea clavata]